MFTHIIKTLTVQKGRNVISPAAEGPHSQSYQLSWGSSVVQVHQWEGLTEETSCMGTMAVQPRVGSPIDTRFTFFLTLQSPVLTFFRRTFVPRMYTRTWKGSDCSWLKSSWVICLQQSLQAIPDYYISFTPLSNQDSNQDSRWITRRNFKWGRCAHCNSSHRRKDTTWFCRECEVWLCHNGDLHGDCFLQWHQGRELWDFLTVNLSCT